MSSLPVLGVGKPCIALYTIVFDNSSAQFGERLGHIKRDEIESFFAILLNSPRFRELRTSALEASSRRVVMNLLMSLGSKLKLLQATMDE